MSPLMMALVRRNMWEHLTGHHNKLVIWCICWSSIRIYNKILGPITKIIFAFISKHTTYHPNIFKYRLQSLTIPNLTSRVVLFFDGLLLIKRLHSIWATHIRSTFPCNVPCGTERELHPVLSGARKGKWPIVTSQAPAASAAARSIVCIWGGWVGPSNPGQSSP
jgi:hypothetical protein